MRVCVNELESLVVFLFNPCPGRQSLTQIRTYLLLNQFKDMPQDLFSTTTLPLQVSLKCYKD